MPRGMGWGPSGSLISAWCCLSLQLTAKRLQCIRSLVNLAQCYAEDLGSGWRVLLQTLHHLTHVLGLQPQANGALRPVRTLETPSMVGGVWGRGLGLVVWEEGDCVWCAALQVVPASPGKKSALSMLCDLLSNLFDSSQ